MVRETPRVLHLPRSDDTTGAPVGVCITFCSHLLQYDSDFLCELNSLRACSACMVM